MSEAVEGGAALAWRLLATLEGGSLVLAATALWAYTAARKTVTASVHTVLVTNTTAPLGKELKSRLESRGCTVSTLTSGAEVAANKVETADKVDAIVVVGAEPRVSGLDGIAELVSQDVYKNLKILDNVSCLVRRGGRIAWACSGRTAGAFEPANEAFDSALRASLGHVASTCGCEAVWIGRCESVEEAAERLVNALVPHSYDTSRFSLRNAASKISSFFGRWLKIAA